MLRLSAGYVQPYSIFHYIAHLMITYVEYLYQLPYCSASSIRLTNTAHLICGKFAMFSLISRSLKCAVKSIASTRIPPQVTNRIVTWVTVIMTGFHIARARACKCFQYKSVNVDIMEVPLFSKGYAQIPFAVRTRNEGVRVLAHVGSFPRPDLTKTRNLITDITRYVTPFFRGYATIFLHRKLTPFVATPPAVTSSAGAFRCLDYSTSVLGGAT